MKDFHDVVAEPAFLTSHPKTKRLRTKKPEGRIESLVIPPAWEDVWICSDEKGHIQCRGVDEAGRTQYIYHPLWQQASSMRKFDRMHRMAEVLTKNSTPSTKGFELELAIERIEW